MKSIPTIQRYMTVLPHTIGFDRPLRVALEMMREYQIRHLPVLKAGQLIGIVTDRDIRLVLNFRDADADTITAEEALTPDPYCTSPNAKLDEVVGIMAEKKYGSALVVDNHKLVGIFTEIDAYKALSELLSTRLA